MKPILEPVEHTAEDAIAWAQVNWRGGPRGGPVRWTLSLLGDNRDAALMLAAQTAPLCECCQEQMSVVYSSGQRIDIRGTVEHPP